MLAVFLVLITNFITTNFTLADDFYSKYNLIKENRGEPAITFEYYQGEYLIYDCRNRHFACVNQLSFERCQSKRSSDRYLKKISFRCAPLKKYENQEKCFEAQLSFTQKPRKKPFCQ